MKPNRRLLAIALCLGLSAAAADAQQNLLYWMPPAAVAALDTDLGQARPRASYSAAHYFQQGIEASSETISYQDHQLTASVPIINNETRELSAILQLGWMDIETDAVLPRPGEKLPPNLYDVSVGLAYRQNLDNGHSFGGSLTVGSPSDKPFASAEELLVNLNAYYRLPAGQKDAWLLMLNWSNGRDFAEYIPLPGVGYFHDAGDDLKILAGVPFSSIVYRPVENLILQADYTLLRDATAKVTWQIARDLSLYGQWTWDTRTYFRHDRDDDDDRLFYHEKTAAVGLRWNLTRDIYLDASGGYAYQRFFAEDDDFDDHTDNQIEIGDGFFIGLTLGVSF
ncbi:MAG: hypothetical protein ACLFUJ_04110 [Phycisphaerae bacterium]